VHVAFDNSHAAIADKSEATRNLADLTDQPAKTIDVFPHSLRRENWNQ